MVSIFAQTKCSTLLQTLRGNHVFCVRSTASFTKYPLEGLILGDFVMILVGMKVAYHKIPVPRYVLERIKKEYKI
jgi:hypothetical protein